MGVGKKTYKPLDDLLDRTGLKKCAIADRLGVDSSTLYKWRVSPNTMGIDEMEKLSSILGVDFFDLYQIVKKFKIKVDKNATKPA